MRLLPESIFIKTQISLALALLLFVGCKTSEQANSVRLENAQYALWDAAKSGDVDILEAAIAQGADVNALDVRTNQNGRRALNWAAWNNHVDAIEVLLEHRADVDGFNRTGFTAIHHSAENGSADAARVLIEAGADVNLPSLAGESPLERARREGHQEVVELLERAGAN